MIEKKFINIFKKELKINNNLKKNLLSQKIDIKMNIFKNWDSMKHVKILISVEDVFKIKINTKNEKFFQSFQNGLSYLKKNTSV
jgi:acyl carrier protein